jgi:hypothetical protein
MPEVADRAKLEPPVAYADLPVFEPGAPAHRKVHPARPAEPTPPNGGKGHRDMDTWLSRSQFNEVRSCLRSELLDSGEVMMEQGIALIIVECKLG